MNKETRPQTLTELLLAGSEERTAVVLPELQLRISYGMLRQQVESVARSLSAFGIGSGERVAMALPNSLATVVCFLAASWVGTAAPLNAGYREDEFRFYLEDTAARILLLPRGANEEARKAAGSRVPVVDVDMDTEGRLRLEGLTSGRSLADPSPEDTALVLHTSGSTGPPKRVPIRHRHLAASVGNIVGTYRLTPDDVSLCVMPLFHVHGLVASLLSTLASGGTVLVPPKFNPMGFWRIAHDYGATWFSAVPTMHQLLLARVRSGDPRPQGASKLRFIRSCSSSLSPDTMRQLEVSFGVPVLEAYGMTEAAHQMASNPLPPASRRPGSVGPGTGVQISIMDSAGTHLPVGRVGEVVIQGPNVIDGYENNPEANASSFTQGWFRTGDQGILDGEGYLTLTGRIKELINRGGEKIAPREIDETLMSHPAVAEAVCFGVPHPAWGEEVAAAAVLRDPAAHSPTEAELIAYCRDHLADFKCPKKIHIVTALPKTASGKIQRRSMAKLIEGNQK